MSYPPAGQEAKGLSGKGLQGVPGKCLEGVWGFGGELGCVSTLPGPNVDEVFSMKRPSVRWAYPKLV